MEWGFRPVTKESQTRHNRRIKKQKDRGEFTPAIRKKIVNDQNGQCYLCGRPTTYIHHVFPRGRGGRGVYTNGMLACTLCHNPKIHDIGKVDYYIEIWKKEYGPHFYMDDMDLKQLKTKGMF